MWRDAHFTVGRLPATSGRQTKAELEGPKEVRR